MFVLSQYFKEMQDVLTLDKPTQNAIEQLVTLLQETAKSGKKCYIIGNGGSAGIASHLALDFSKNAGIPMLTFTDNAFVTALANDYGYEYVYQKGVEYFGNAGDTLVAISSSGTSKNIIMACETAKQQGLNVVTLSGINKNPPLAEMGAINFWVDSQSYNIVETAHQFYLMAALDNIIGKSVYKVGLK